MATIKQLIERIETRLFFVAGLDVQVHAEGQIEEMLRGVYNTLFDDFWAPEYTKLITVTLDGTNGQSTTDLSTLILRYMDIHSVFLGEDDRPLPRVMPGTAFSHIRTRSLVPSGNPATVFRVLPKDTTGEAHVWYRTRISDAVWDNNDYDTEIEFDDDVLMLGVVYEFLMNDGSNHEATSEYKTKFMSRQKQIRDAQWNIPMSKHKLGHDGPLTRWE